MSDSILKTNNLHALCSKISEYLQIEPSQINGQSNLFEYGMDSMHLMSWVNRFRKQGYKVKLKELYNNPTPSGWYQLLQQKNVFEQEKTFSKVSLPVMKKGEAFELTPVQHAYFVGRASHQVLGGVGCHLYQEFDGVGLSAEVLEKAIYTLIERHNMLKVKFNSDGFQEYQGFSFWNGLTVYNFQENRDYEKQLLDIRKQLDHRVLDVESGETFDIQLSLLPNGKHRVHVNIDLLILDAASFSLFFEELSALILGETLNIPDKKYDFCSYLAHINQQNFSERESAKLYWQKKITTLPLAPALPLAKKPEQINKVLISRRCEEINKSDWEKFEKSSASIGATPTMVLATCFGAVLSRWSNQQRILLNLTLFDRSPLHDSVDKMLADFTNILLIDLRCSGESLGQMVKENQNTFVEAYENRHWTGVDLLRKLKKTGTHSNGAPVVFTCNLGRSLYGNNISKALGEPSWGISQTPQVWIDHLAYTQGSSTYLRWDSNNELFPPHLVDSMFEAYISIVRQLINNPDMLEDILPDLMPESQYKQRQIVNKTESYIPEDLLHFGFLKNVKNTPDAISLIHNSVSITYGELNEMVQKCAGMLISKGVKAGDRVAITMSKGVGQIVSSLAILQVGAIYVPVALEQPVERRKTICKNANVTVILVCKNDTVTEEGNYDESIFTVLKWQEYINFSAVDNSIPVDVERPAYIIYTSGSTGMPKGVVISHKGALNTCYDINKRYNIQATDRVLALSEFHFDLSVYDIFGVLTAGGAIVLVNQFNRRDPSHWCELIEQHNVTIWNTVPALFDMFLTYSEGMNLTAPVSIYTVMLSGDWIGLDLFERYRNFQKNGKFIAMGGATEASIWSNALEVKAVPNDWHSIPYGFPLANQQYRVVDSVGRDCPDWVSGELWIGGQGVALGYFNDADKTSAQFLEKDNIRWYRTGDMGRYWNDGMLEFLGRKDKQVKVGGYRIELGEVETALNKIKGVKGAVSLALGEKEKMLVAFVTTENKTFQSAILGDIALPKNYSVLLENNKNVVNGAVTQRHDKKYEENVSKIVADFLFTHLQKQGVDFSSTINLETAMNCYGVDSLWSSIFKRWLRLLVKHAYILQENKANNYVLNSKRPSDIVLPKNNTLLLLKEGLLNYHTTLSQMIKGQRRVETLLNHSVFSPESLLSNSDGMEECVNELVQIIKVLYETLQRPIKIIEVGARSGITAEKILQKLAPEYVEYIALDESQEMVIRATTRFEFFLNTNAYRQEKALLDTMKHQADIVFSNNFLHRESCSFIKNLYDLSKPSGLIYVLEKSTSSDIGLITVDLFSPEGNGLETILRSPKEWKKDFAQYKLECQAIDKVAGIDRFIFRMPNEIFIENTQEIIREVSRHLPSYMIPKKINIIKEFPLTTNGKIDYTLLKSFYETTENSNEKISTQDIFDTEIEKSLAEILCELLNLESINRKSNFFQLGVDSLLATRLIGKLGEIGYKAELADLFNYPEFDKFSATIVPKKEVKETTLTIDESSRYDAFALSDIQQAYLAGREKGFLLGGVGSQFFVEFDVGELDTLRFEKAVNYLINRHDMLRTVVEGVKQKVLKNTPSFVLKIHTVDEFNNFEAKKLRDKLSAQVIDPSCWPVFDIQAMKNESEKYRIFVCLDNLMLDGLSMKIFFAELEQRYLFPDVDFPKLNVTFREYLMRENSREPSPNSITYWQQRLESLPSAPKLPLIKNPSDVERPKFIRFADKLTENEWSALKYIAKKEGITPSALLLSAYGSVLSSWSTNNNISINLTLFDRKPLHPQMDQVLGDFTSLLLVSWEPENNWRESVQKLQKRLQKDIVHSDVSAIWVMRQLALKRGYSEALMPVVFTSALGFEDTKFLSHASWLKPHWGISQTPQVWLDNQVYETGGELYFNWDVVEELFNVDEISIMFKQYKSLLLQLANNQECWDKNIDTLVPKNINENLVKITNSVVNGSIEKIHLVDKKIVENVCEQFEKVVENIITPNQNFFEAGASSLQLIEIHRILQKSLYKELTITDFFTYPTPSGLAGYLNSINEVKETFENTLNLKQKELLKRRKRRALARK